MIIAIVMKSEGLIGEKQEETKIIDSPFQE